MWNRNVLSIKTFETITTVKEKSDAMNPQSFPEVLKHMYVLRHTRRADYQQAERAGTAVRVTGPHFRSLQASP